MDARDLVGAWRIAEYTLTEADGTVTRPWLEGSDGLLIYTADGYMSANTAVIIAAETPKQRTHYAGPYEVHDDHVIHHIQFSNREDLVGTDQKRMTDYDGTYLRLTCAPSITGGPGSSAVLRWRRVD